MRLDPVSYTHLDVYKRQALGRAVGGVAGEYNPSGYNLPAVTGMVNFGTITGSGNAMGGIFGLMDDSNNATDIKVENCYSVGQLLLVGTGTTVGNICGEAVSYTHLDVYKRQILYRQDSGDWDGLLLYGESGEQEVGRAGIQ